MRPLLVLRPEPGAGATAARARAMGLTVVVAPLFTLEPVAWSPPADPPDAILLTSANAARLSGPLPPAWRGIPIYAVGPATGEAARAAGMKVAHVGGGDGDEAARAAVAAGHARIVRLCGADRRTLEAARPGLTEIVVYAAEPVATLPEPARAAVEAGAVAMLHSPAAAALFSRLLADGAGRARTAIVAISARACRAAGGGWAGALAADSPCDAAMLALAAPLCQERAVTTDHQP